MVQIVPFIPENITVHLGAPSASAANVTVPFIDYVKNVASSEIYPTWNAAALRANILAIISFALNRIYLEYYRSRGYSFDITSSTAFDQSFVNGRSTFDSIDTLVNELFDDYLRRQGYIEPLAAQFCNGVTVTCSGMSQWGSQNLAEQGYNSVQILRTYYGENVEVVVDAPVQSPAPSYPGQPLRLGSVGPNVVRVQFALNRISQNFPLIPKINPVDGIFGQQTEQSVRTFQSVFELTEDGIVGEATWYALVRLFVGLSRLSELTSEGQRYSDIPWEYPDVLQEGSTGQRVQQLRYMLSVLSQFIAEIPDPGSGTSFDAQTRQAVIAFQRWAGLSQTGLVGDVTWDRLYGEYDAVNDDLENDLGDANTTQPQMTQFPGYDLTPGTRDENQEATT